MSDLLTFDRKAASDFLDRRFGDAGSGQVEIAIIYRDPKAGKPVKAQHFRHDQREDALNFAARYNAVEGYNAYVGVCVREGAPDTGRAEDAHVRSVNVLWVDLDTADPDVAYAKCEASGYLPDYTVRTGSAPNERWHLYYPLAEEITPDQARDLNRRLALHLDGDRAVTNPSRIMRLPGSIAWAKHKDGAPVPGRVDELTSYVHLGNGAVTFEELDAAFPEPQETAPSNMLSGADLGPRNEREESEERLRARAIAALDASANRLPDRQDLIDVIVSAKSASDHPDMLAAVMRWAAKWIGDANNPPDPEGFAKYAEAQWHSITPRGAMSAGTLFQKLGTDGRNLIRFGQEAHDRVHFSQGLIIESSAEFVNGFVPADYVIDGSVRQGYVYTFTSRTGHGKTAVTLAIAYAIASGGSLGHIEVKPGRVLYMAGENADDVRPRWKAQCERDGIDPDSLAIDFAPGAFAIREHLDTLAQRYREDPLTLIVCDTLAAYYDGDEENSNTQRMEFARNVLRRLSELPGRPCVIAPAHPVARAERSNLVPKGGSSLLNEVDGNLAGWMKDGIVEVHWQGKFRGAFPEPLKFKLEGYESDSMLDSRGRRMPTVVARTLLQSEELAEGEKSLKAEDDALRAIDNNPEISVRGLAEAIGKSKSRAGEIRKSLIDRKWVEERARKLFLTSEGREVIGDA